MEKEIWKNIPGFEHYQASSSGRIKSLERNVLRRRKCGRLFMVRFSGRILKVGVNPVNGRKFFHACCGSGRKTLYVHRAVAAAFWGWRKNMEINHINGNPGDNSIKNLEWCTAKENLAHALANRLHLHSTSFSKEDVATIRFFYSSKCGTGGTNWILGKIFDCHISTISRVGTRKTYACFQ